MFIDGREVKTVYLKDRGILYVELLLKGGDCPEKKRFPQVQLCPGECQGTYLSVVVQGGRVRIMGGIYSKQHFMYSKNFVRGHNLRGENVAEQVKSYLEKNPVSIESSMDGRKEKVYVEDEHVGTFFEGCVFRMAQGEFAALLAREREKELAGISQNLEKIKRIATPATTEEFGKFARFQE